MAQDSVFGIHKSDGGTSDGDVMWEYYVDAQRAGDFLGIDRRTVQRWARQSRIPAHPLNDGSHRDWRFLISELDAWLRARVNSLGRPRSASRRIQ